MPISPERVWAWLVRAPLWPTWYPNSKNVRFIEGELPDLALGTQFRWRTFNVGIKSQVKEFEPFERIAWDARGFSVYAYHAWLLRETSEGCHVITEERQHGWGARLQAGILPARMSNGHQVWLERLCKWALEGPPGPVPKANSSK